MVYILFILIAGYPQSDIRGISLESVTMEITSEKSCLAAGRTIVNDIQDSRGNIRVVSWGCVEK